MHLANHLNSASPLQETPTNILPTMNFMPGGATRPSMVKTFPQSFGTSIYYDYQLSKARGKFGYEVLALKL